jgi:murein DD-endopeptidase MepM/ murein hydrolase activator NlpD
MRIQFVSSFLLILSFFCIYQGVGLVTAAFAYETDTSSMESLALQSLDTPVNSEPTNVVPDVSIVPPSTLTVPELTQIAFQYPLVVSPVITTFFSPSHHGVDFAVASGTPIVAAESGLVTTAGWDTTGYGQTIVLHHTKNTYTRYAHLSELGVRVGQYVFKGMPLGLVGCTGRCTGPHLHFEIRLDNQFVNPLTFVAF